MKKTSIVNVYNFIRMSHQEPSEFLQADFDTLAKQIRILKQYGLPSTYALKYDALMHPKYQELLLTEADANDEIGAWWEISEPLCKKAGVSFRGQESEVFDERVNSAYSVGYTVEERKLLVDAYMEDFRAIFGYYPKTIGSWILDNVTISYAQEKYGIIGAAICRDQMGTDGFTLWGGIPNGAYFPSKNNLYLPSQTVEETLPVATFRMLGADPILSFEQDVREGLSGVYTLEPCCTSGRSAERIAWYFSTITTEDGAGIGYAQVGQENSFLWENIRPGFEPQVKHIKELSEKGLLRIETLEESAEWFAKKYTLTPPMCWQASVTMTPEMSIKDEGVVLDTQWYASRFYRVGFLAEKKHLRIRDWFLYREKYPCRYLNEPIKTAASYFDALPVLFAQKWKKEANRPFVRLMKQEQENWVEISGDSHFSVPDEFTSGIQVETEQETYSFAMTEKEMCIIQTCGQDKSELPMFALQFDILPVFTECKGEKLYLNYEGFSYCLEVTQGQIITAGEDGVCVQAKDGVIRFNMAASIESVTKQNVYTNVTTSNFVQKKECENVLTEQEHIAQECKKREKTEEKDTKQVQTTENLFTEQYLENPEPIDNWRPRWVREPLATAKVVPFEPEFSVPESCFDLATDAKEVNIYSVQQGATVRFVTHTEHVKDSTVVSIPNDATVATEAVVIEQDTKLCAISYLSTGEKSEAVCSNYRFGWKDVQLKSDSSFVARPVFDCGGIRNLLKEERGSTDWQDGKWLATQDNLDFICTLPEKRTISCVEVGFLTNHRSGIIYPESLELYAGDDEEHLELISTKKLPEGPAKAEIAKEDFGFEVQLEARCIRFVAKRYALMPQWCCYKGTPDVFTLVDCLIIR